MKFQTTVSDEAAELRDSSPERQCLFELLEAYWGKGDGAPAPAFIAEAARLCGFPLQTTGSTTEIKAACGEPVPGMGLYSLCTRDAGHEGEHRCKLADVQDRRGY